MNLDLFYLHFIFRDLYLVSDAKNSRNSGSSAYLDFRHTLTHFCRSVIIFSVGLETPPDLTSK